MRVPILFPLALGEQPPRAPSSMDILEGLVTIVQCIAHLAAVALERLAAALDDLEDIKLAARHLAPVSWWAKAPASASALLQCAGERTGLMSAFSSVTRTKGAGARRTFGKLAFHLFAGAAW